MFKLNHWLNLSAWCLSGAIFGVFISILGLHAWIVFLTLSFFLLSLIFSLFGLCEMIFRINKAVIELSYKMDKPQKENPFQWLGT